MADIMNKNLMSERGLQALKVNTFSALIQERMKNIKYHKTNNPMGVINMGTAVNRLMEKELQEKLNGSDALKFSVDTQHYYDFVGSEELRTAIADFFNRHFNPRETVTPDELLVMNGVTSCLDALGHTIADPGDVIISPTPVYGRIFTDFTDRTRVTVKPLSLHQEKKDEIPTFTLTSDAVEQKIIELQKSGDNVKGFILLNPNNPLGEIYEPNLVLEIAEVCARYKLHLIIDEIYALSIIDPEISFVSSLSLLMPDPERTHFCWGFSKDFGLAGLRAGVIRSKNKHFRTCLKAIGIYQATPSLVHQALTTLITDIKWCDDFFIPTNQKKLQRTYKKACQILESESIVVRKSQAGFFLWVYVAPYLTALTEAAEMELFEEIFNAGLYIVPATELFTKPGWFRIIYSVSDEEIEVGLARLIKVLRGRKNS